MKKLKLKVRERRHVSSNRQLIQYEIFMIISIAKSHIKQKRCIYILELFYLSLNVFAIIMLIIHIMILFPIFVLK